MTSVLQCRLFKLIHSWLQPAACAPLLLAGCMAVGASGMRCAAAHQVEDADTLKGVTLKEITVKRTKNHYSKRNNPAVDFVNRIRTAKSLADPKRHDNYSYRKYDKISVGINNIALPDSTTPAGRGQLAFLREHVDTSDVTGLPILPLSVKEKVSDYYFRREPHAEKLHVRGTRQNGVDEVADLQSIQTALEDIFREVDLYDNDIPLMRNRFVSPLSAIGPDFYKYFLTDTVMLGDRRCVLLSFAPRNPATFGFLGRVWVEEGDSTMFVRKVRMGVSPTINLNFVDRLQIEQEFEKAPDGSRLKVRDDLNATFKVLPGHPELYARRTTGYDSHSFLPPASDSIFATVAEVITDPEAAAKSEEFWARERQVHVTDNEGRIHMLMSRLRGVPIYHYGENVLRVLVKGYVPTSKNSLFDLGPLNTFIGGNPVEGLRLRVGGMSTAQLSNQWFTRGYVAYGFKDRKWKYNAELEYSFLPKKKHAMEFPVHSITFQEKYDIDQLGQRYQFTNPDNIFIALKRGENHLITYTRHTAATYKLELLNNLSFNLSADAVRREPGPYVPFLRADGTTLSHYNQLTFTAQIRFAPGEKFYQGQSYRLAINNDAPIFILSHEYSPRNILGAPYEISKTELSVAKRVWLSAFGYLDLMGKGGHVWTRSPYPSLLTPNVNLSYTIQPESFALMNPLEFINDSFVSWEATYWANGTIFNYIPLFKRLKLREVVAFRGWLGTLSDRNNPIYNSSDPLSPNRQLLLFPAEAHVTPMHGRPYMEISAGIDNLLKCVRLDYVWRLSYLNTPATNRSGLRLALHFNF